MAEGERAQHQHSVVKTTADGRDIKIMGPSCLGPLLPFLVLSSPAYMCMWHDGRAVDLKLLDARISTETRGGLKAANAHPAFGHLRFLAHAR